MVLVWDNRSSHTCKPVAVQVAVRDWLSVVCPPRYAPELNLVEPLRSHLKRVLRSRLFRNLEELKQALEAVKARAAAH
ncbi:transposase [Nocardiopsis quinghaiensis]|uniref:transposase n=1 Tax=Nocardiopsis quinghaiensis TaxID=464995 RepID=UPI0021DFD525|nr:transposase [Nocardiopsis quinghaiensis]